MNSIGNGDYEIREVQSLLIQKGKTSVINNDARSVRAVMILVRSADEVSIEAYNYIKENIGPYESNDFSFISYDSTDNLVDSLKQVCNNYNEKIKNYQVSFTSGIYIAHLGNTDSATWKIIHEQAKVIGCWTRLIEAFIFNSQYGDHQKEEEYGPMRNWFVEKGEEGYETALALITIRRLEAQDPFNLVDKKLGIMVDRLYSDTQNLCSKIDKIVDFVRKGNISLNEDSVKSKLKLEEMISVAAVRSPQLNQLPIVNPDALIHKIPSRPGLVSLIVTRFTGGNPITVKVKNILQIFGNTNDQLTCENIRYQVYTQECQELHDLCRKIINEGNLEDTVLKLSYADLTENIPDYLQRMMDSCEKMRVKLNQDIAEGLDQSKQIEYGSFRMNAEQILSDYISKWDEYRRTVIEKVLIGEIIQFMGNYMRDHSADFTAMKQLGDMVKNMMPKTDRYSFVDDEQPNILPTVKRVKEYIENYIEKVEFNRDDLPKALRHMESRYIFLGYRNIGEATLVPKYYFFANSDIMRDYVNNIENGINNYIGIGSSNISKREIYFLRVFTEEGWRKREI